MKSFPTAIIALLLWFSISTASAELRELEERHVGNWELTAYADESGEPALCTVQGLGLSQGHILGVTVERSGNWFLDILGEEVNDGERGFTYTIDGGAPTTATAKSFAPNLLRVALGASFSATEPLRQGNRLAIRYRGGQVSFSLKGSSNALEGLLDCAVRHLGYHDDPNLERIGDWLVLRKPLEDGSCRALITGEDNIAFIFSHTEEIGYFIRILHRKGKWDLHEGDIYELTYRIDNGPPVEIHAAGASEDSVLMALGRDAAALQPFEDGHLLQVQAQRIDLRLNLQGAMAALDVLKACAQGLVGQNDADAADPFSSAGANGAGESSPKTGDPSRPSDPANAVDDPDVERTLAAVKTLRLAQIIFARDPRGEDELRDRLRAALRGVPAGDKQVVAMLQAQAFLYSYVERAIKVAPSDVLARLISLNLAAMQRLQSQPDHCAAFFNASGAGDLSYLPQDMRIALAEIYADLVEAAAVSPVAKATIGDEEFVVAMAEAYAANGFSKDDMTKFDDIGTLGSRETCRLGTQLSIALAWLPEDTGAAIFRKVYSSWP